MAAAPGTTLSTGRTLPTGVGPPALLESLKIIGRVRPLLVIHRFQALLPCVVVMVSPVVRTRRTLRPRRPAQGLTLWTACRSGGSDRAGSAGARPSAGSPTARPGLSRSAGSGSGLLRTRSPAQILVGPHHSQCVNFSASSILPSRPQGADGSRRGHELETEESGHGHSCIARDALSPGGSAQSQARAQVQRLWGT